MPTTPWTFVARRLAAVAGATALALPAQAAIVHGNWDPAFGAPFPDLGWRGTTSINVPAACLALSGTVVNDGVACPLMSVLAADVEFYDLGDPLLTTAETLDFGSLVAVDRIVVNGGLVEAFALDSLGSVLSTTPLGVTSPPPGAQAWFSLELDFVEDVTTAVLSWTENEGNPTGGRNDPAFPAVVRITQDPEGTPVPLPATLALALAGLALLGATRRR